MIIGYCGFSIENYFGHYQYLICYSWQQLESMDDILRGHTSERVFEIFMNRIRAENPSI